MAPASSLGILPKIDKTAQGLVQLGMEEVTTGSFSFEEQASQRRKRLVELFAVEHTGSREIVMQVGIEFSFQLFGRIDAVEENQRVLGIPDALLDMVDGIVQLQVPDVDSEGPTSIGLLLGREFCLSGSERLRRRAVTPLQVALRFAVKFSNQRISR